MNRSNWRWLSLVDAARTGMRRAHTDTVWHETGTTCHKIDMDWLRLYRLSHIMTQSKAHIGTIFVFPVFFFEFELWSERDKYQYGIQILVLTNEYNEALYSCSMRLIINVTRELSVWWWSWSSSLTVRCFIQLVSLILK